MDLKSCDPSPFNLNGRYPGATTYSASTNTCIGLPAPRSGPRVSHRLTTFTLAHQLSTIRKADEIWVMDQVALAKRGTHNDLVAQDGV